MALRDFRDAYQEAINELPKFSLDADKVQEELRRRRRKAAVRRRAFTSAAAAASVFLLLGLGTAVAVNYQSGRLSVKESGFAFEGGEAAKYSSDNKEEKPAMMSLPIEGGRMAVPEEIDEAVPEAFAENEEAVPGEADTAGDIDKAAAAGDAGGADTAGDVGGANTAGDIDKAAAAGDADGVDTAGDVDGAATVGDIDGAAAGNADGVDTAGDASEARDGAADEGEEADETGTECLEIEYDTIEAFLAAETIPIAIPTLDSLGMNSLGDRTVEFQNVTVIPDIGDVCVNVGFDDGRTFFMNQQDNRGSLGYASGHSYPGKMVNERSLTSDQGLVWTLADCEQDGEVVGICAAISVNERDIVMSFFGYENVEVDAILKHLDFSIYFEEDF